MSRVFYENLGFREYPEPARFNMRGRWIANPFSNTLDRKADIALGKFAFSNLEARYVAAKTRDPGIRAQIAPMSGLDAKRFGRGLEKDNSLWNATRFSAMWSGLVQVWMQPIFKAQLPSFRMAPSNAIVEWNNWGDDLWGCVIGRKGVKAGHNVLGRMLSAIEQGPPAALLMPEMLHDEDAWPALQNRLIEHLAGIDLDFAVGPAPKASSTPTDLFALDAAAPRLF